jgi:hypothetical protein
MIHRGTSAAALHGAVRAAIRLAPGTDKYQVGQIRDAQEKFLTKHAPALRELDKHLRDAREAMHKLAGWLKTQHMPDNDIRGIMEKKAATGKRAMADRRARLGQESG